MTDEQKHDLVKECGLDWHRGFMPLFEGDTTNRYSVLIDAVQTAELAALKSQEPVFWARYPRTGLASKAIVVNERPSDVRGYVPLFAAAPIPPSVPEALDALDRLYRWSCAMMGCRVVYTGDHPIAVAERILAAPKPGDET